MEQAIVTQPGTGATEELDSGLDKTLDLVSQLIALDTEELPSTRKYPLPIKVDPKEAAQIAEIAAPGTNAPPGVVDLYSQKDVLESLRLKSEGARKDLVIERHANAIIDRYKHGWGFQGFERLEGEFDEKKYNRALKIFRDKIPQYIKKGTLN